ncbi:hypothetical protein HYALB_00007701 [Hymenoscyphus albidus]|uniref:Rhodopsin domain-containing protein n=1 Tax=Hymenoscyphus albidus TaxID=595503 RepID=A0A9N9LJJ6_9HELO|nr:hypothetical protein HYALB_00007701 [Hymenoscyphus albidus]
MTSANSSSPEAIQRLLDGPALTPPAGVEPDFENPGGFKGTIVGFEVLFMVISSLAMIVRLYTRLRIYKKVKLDDYLAVLGWFGYLWLLITSVRGLNESSGIHQWNVQAKKMEGFLYHLHIIVIMYGIDMFTIKFSILLQYVALFSPSRRDTFFWSCYFLIGLNFVTYTTFVILEIITCQTTLYTRSQRSRCMDFRTVNLATVAVNTASHIAILLLPQAIIWRLRLTFSKRLGISLVFAVALLACVASVVRLYYAITQEKSSDITWYVGLNIVLIYPEIGFAIITSCLPSFPKFFRTIFKPPSPPVVASKYFFPTHERSLGRQGTPLDSVDRLAAGIEMQTPSSVRKGETMFGEADFVERSDSRR